MRKKLLIESIVTYYMRALLFFVGNFNFIFLNTDLNDENDSSTILYRTDQDGSVILKIKNNKLKIETCLP